MRLRMSEDSRDEGKIARAPDSGVDDPARSQAPPSGDDDPLHDREPRPEGASPRRRSGWWFLLPILFGIIGGAVSYFAIRRDDPQKAKNCIILGAILSVILFVLPIISLAPAVP